MPNPLKRKENESIPGALKPGKSTRKINNLHTVFSYSSRIGRLLHAASGRRLAMTTERMNLMFIGVESSQEDRPMPCSGYSSRR